MGGNYFYRIFESLIVVPGAGLEPARPKSQDFTPNHVGFGVPCTPCGAG